MMMIKSTKASEAGSPPSPLLMEGMGRLTQEMAQAGVLVLAEGLQPSSRGTRLSYRGERRTVTDGPFAEAKELVGGFAILKVGSKQEALAMAERVLDVHIQAGEKEFELEMRPLFDPEDRASAR
jgi:hypothetical protein